MKKKIEIDIPENYWKLLKDESRSMSISETEVIRLAIMEYFRKQTGYTKD